MRRTTDRGCGDARLEQLPIPHCIEGKLGVVVS